MTKVLAQRSDSRYLVQLQKKKYALVNLLTENVLYETDCDVFYKTGYFIRIDENRELSDRLKSFFEKTK